MRSFWTEEQLQILKDNYADKPGKDVALLVGRTYNSVIHKAQGLGLTKSEAFFKSPESGRLTGIVGADTRFKPNYSGWNKGKKREDYMSAESIAKCNKTTFKKGQDPHNTVPIGTERISKDGYVEVKVFHNKGTLNKNFRFKHHIVYEENFGPIPKGMVVTIKGNDKVNFKPCDLELITMKENMLRNSYCDKSIVKRFMGVKEPELVDKIINELPGVVELKRKSVMLNQQINKQYAK